MDYDNSEVEELWCNQCRNDVIAYLRRQNLVHGQVGEWPAWHLAPYISIWAIESKDNPGWVGWWAVAGDLPHDYVSASGIKHPREAMQAIARRWHTAAEHMARGSYPTDFSIGSPDSWPSLGPQLASRAELLQSWAGDPELWANL
ncbi:DUF4826 family protein [Oleiagrimonas sp. C23AA]|nr:DUF4826 family protein [Oleiagrimonas sp. C23AA]